MDPNAFNPPSSSSQPPQGSNSYNNFDPSQQQQQQQQYLQQQHQQQQQQQQHGGGAGGVGSQSIFNNLSDPNRPPLPQGLTVDMAQSMTKDKFKAIVGRIQMLRTQNMNEHNSQEAAQLMNVVKMFGKAQEWNKLVFLQNQQRKTNGSVPTPPTNASSLPTNSSGQQQIPSLSPEQIAQLRTQIHSWKLLNRNLPLPSHLQTAATLFGLDKEASAPPSDAPGEATNNNLSDGLEKKLAEAAVDVAGAAEAREKTAAAEGESTSNGGVAANGDVKTESSTAGPSTTTEDKEPEGPLPYAMENDKESGIHPYNSYTHPLTLLKRPAPVVPFAASKQQKLLVPSLMPTGMDPYALLEERNRFVETRIKWRIEELEQLPSTLGQGAGPEPVNGLIQSEDPNAKARIRALIELKALGLLEKQKQFREDLVRSLNSSSSLSTDRNQFRRTKKIAIRDARQTEALERKQRAERDKKVKQKQLDYVSMICNHGKELLRAGSAANERQKKMGKMVLSYHSTTEKEEQKRVERISKERLRALKNDDEEAYLKLIDTAKDTRITHLIRQTDSYLDSLAQAVVAQQNDDVHRDHHAVPFETEKGEADETMFGGKKEEAEPGEDPNKVSYYAVSHRITEKITKQPSILVGGTLKEYQLKGLQWMVSLYNNRLNGILADEMGLGKTIQTLSLITFLIESKKQHGPYLVIVPLSTITNWTLEFEKWAPSVSTVIYKGTPQARRDAAVKIKSGNFQVLITTFEYIIREKALLGKIKWVHMIIDEGHRMKNAESKLSQTLSLYYTARYRLILTGTPLQNNLPELWALLNFVLPKIFNSVKSFDEWFNTPFANSGASDKMGINEEEQLLIIRRLHKVLRPFLLRRLKKDVESELPDKVEKVIKCKMSALQQRIYTTYRKHGFLQSEGLDKTGKSNIVKGLNNTVMQLRKICNHPFVIEAIEAQVNPLKVSDDRLWRSSGKFELLDRILPKLFATDHRVLMFFQMVNIMHIFEDYLIYRGYGDCLLRLDGSTKADDRTDLITKFNAPDSPYKIFILSTRAGGLGLNLQTADTVIIYDSDWNPHADLQAQDRAHRIGQKKVVKIFRLVTNKSIEEDILATAQGKLAIDGKVIQAGKFDNKSSAAEQEALLRSLLEAEVEEGDEDDNGEMGDEEINELLARGDHEMPIFQAMDIQREKDAKAQWKAQGGTGPHPERLMTDEEVPEVYRRDVVIVSTEKEEDEGRGQRVKAAVIYDDGLTEEQFLNQLENDEDQNEEEAAERKRQRASRKANKSQVQSSEDEAAPGGDDDDESDDPYVSKKTQARGSGKKRGRPKKIVDDDEDDDSVGNRKRGRPSASVTPSVADDDDDTRDSKRRKVAGGYDKQHMKTALMAVFDGLTGLHNATMDQPHAAAFMTTVSKKEYPSYHLMVKKPIWFNAIRNKIQKNQYKDVNQAHSDFQLIFTNARIFNEEGSWVYQDANVLEQNLPILWASHIVGSGLPGADGTPGGGSSTVGGSSAVPSAVGTGTSTPAPASVTDGEPRKVMLKFGAGGGGGSVGAGAGAGPSRLREEEDQDQAEDSASSEED